MGNQDFESIRKITEEAIPAMEEAKAKFHHLRLLVDMTKHGKVTTGSTRAAMKMLELVPFDKLAIYGAPTHVGHIAEAVLTAIANKNVAIFKLKDEAMRWLAL